MAYVSYADEGETLDPTLAELYEQNRNREQDCVDNILRIHSHSPPSLKGHLGLYKSLMFGKSELSRAQREMIAVVVSTINECHY